MGVSVVDSAVDRVLMATRGLGLVDKENPAAGANIVIRAQRRAHRMFWIFFAVVFAGLVIGAIRLRGSQNAPYEASGKSE
ncbi:MAG: hypothetical protein AAF735_02845 [Myxococcota bacterium]